MAGSLEGVDLKLGRAKRHLEDLFVTTNRSFGPGHQSFVAERDVAAGASIYRVYGVPPINPDWLLILGDFLHNLRGSLDHLAHQLVLRENLVPTDRTQFPVLVTPPTDKGGARKTVQIWPGISSPGVLRAIDEVQPYQRRDDPDPRADFLWVLHRLNIIDKHRFLVVVASAVDEFNVGLDPDVARIRTNQSSDLKDGDRVIDIEFEGREPPADFDPQLALQIVVDEPELALFRGFSVPMLCEALFAHIRTEIVQRFEPFFR